MSKLFDELSALKKAYDEKLANEGEAALKEAFKEVFDKHPRLKSIVWTQYSPYFNDGDECRFSVREFDAHLHLSESNESSSEDEDEDEDEDDYSEDHDDGDYKDYNYGEVLYSFSKSKDPELKAIYDDISELESNLPQDLLESLFDNHVKVVATIEGFDVSEYNHD